MSVQESIRDPRRYRHQIERLHEKHVASRRIYELQQSEVPLASFVLDRRTVARRIARAVGRGEYRLGPAHVRTITSDGKKRVVFAFRLTDLLVHGVVAGIIDEALAPTLSGGLYSYRKGVSWWTAIAAFASYVREHRKSRLEARQRGIYVIRRDIDSYTDSIPVGPRSRVWAMLRDVLGEPVSKDDWRLIETVVRPDAFVKEGSLFTPYRGVPTGQPISCVLFNLYLAGLDEELHRIPGSFYARYCDDIVFAHPDPDIVKAADARLGDALSALSLRLNEKKGRDLYLTAAGRPSDTWPEATGATSVPLLGCLVSAHGTVSLGREKRGSLLADLEARALRTVLALRTSSPDSVGRTVCAVINRALQPRVDFPQQRSAALLRRAVTDRHDLEQLDYSIARIVLRAITGRREVRGFRAVPYRKMREDWGLVSVFHARNRWPTRSRSTIRALRST